MEAHQNTPPARKYLHIVAFTRAMLMAFEGGCIKTVQKRYTNCLIEAGLKANDPSSGASVSACDYLKINLIKNNKHKHRCTNACARMGKTLSFPALSAGRRLLRSL